MLSPRPSDRLARPDRQTRSSALLLERRAEHARASSNFRRMRLHHVAGLAGMEEFKPHPLCDTFGIELPAAGGSMCDVPVLLGDIGIRPWNIAAACRTKSPKCCLRCWRNATSDAA